MILIDTKFVEHHFGVMKNVTITLDEKIVRWARLCAAERATSVSRLVGDMLREKMLLEEGYESAQRQFFAIAPRPSRAPGTGLPGRDEVHDRAGLR